MTLTDERSPSAHRPHPWLLAIATVMVVATAVWAAIVATSPDDSDPEAEATSGAAGARDRASPDVSSLAVVQAQQQALSGRDRRAFMGTWAADAQSRREARMIFTNIGKLDAEVDLHWVETDGSLTGIDPDDAWRAEVDATWQLAGIDRTPASTGLTYTFVADESGHAKVTDVQVEQGGRDPIWLVEPLRVRRGAGWLVAASTASDARRLSSRIPAVLRHVRDVLGTAPGGVAVYGPDSAEALEAVAAAPSGQFEGIAGVTVSVDGSSGRQAPVVLMLNPDVFGRLDSRGRTAVLAHEVTHAVTGASSVDMPLWLAEGFADYVGISAVDVPVGVSARLALRSAARDGIPTKLPTQAAFSQSGARLEVAYEQSWLAVRSIAHRHTEAALLRFYRRVVTEPGRVGAAARDELGVGLDELTRQWRADLRSLLDA